MSGSSSALDADILKQQIRGWAETLGFQKVGFTDTDLGEAAQYFQRWLDQGYHGEMEWMARHGDKRTRPDLLVPGTRTVISVRMDYLPEPMAESLVQLACSDSGFIARYALGRDYHKLMRQRLQRLATQIESNIGVYGYRVFVDSAPVMEKVLAAKAGLGWIGKHTNLIAREAGSWFFLGEIYTDLLLPADQPVPAHCGQCTACMTVCPTQAIIAPYQLDARRCIAYLTIELQGRIPEEFRAAIGNRVYGCDDCQQVCPWNRFAKMTAETDFMPRHQLDTSSLLRLSAWDESTFLHRTEGSALRRLGYERWLRNLAVALGNTAYSEAVMLVLDGWVQQGTTLVQEHAAWAYAQQLLRRKGGASPVQVK